MGSPSSARSTSRQSHRSNPGTLESKTPVFVNLSGVPAGVYEQKSVDGQSEKSASIRSEDFQAIDLSPVDAICAPSTQAISKQGLEDIHATASSEYSASIYSTDVLDKEPLEENSEDQDEGPVTPTCSSQQIHQRKVSDIEAPVILPKAQSEPRRRKPIDLFVGDVAAINAERHTPNPPQRHRRSSSASTAPASIVYKIPWRLKYASNGNGAPSRPSSVGGSDDTLGLKNTAGSENILMRDLTSIDHDRRRTSSLQLSKPKAEATLVFNPFVKVYNGRRFTGEVVDNNIPSSSNLPWGWTRSTDRFIAYLATHAPLTPQGKVPENEQECPRYSYEQMSKMLVERFPVMKCKRVSPASIQNRLDILELSENDYFKQKYGFYNHLKWGRGI